MNLDHIRQRIRGGGFKPFAVRTSDGHEYVVRHPELILVASRSLAVVDDDGVIVTLDPIHIVALKDLPPKKNGAARK